MRYFRIVLAIAVSLFFTQSCQKDEQGCAEKINYLKINELQVVGSHNSYRQKTDFAILQFMYEHPEMLPEGFSPDDWDYDQVPLESQLDDYGMRSLELDVYYDPDGGMFYNRMGLAVIGMSPESGEPALLEPGLKVLHFPDLDFNSHFLTFKDALKAVKAWSEKHYDHVPIVIQIEPKTEDLFQFLGPPFTSALSFDKTALETIDQEIKDVFGANLDQVLTPDKVRKDHLNLNEAIRNNGWPELILARGKVLFVMDATQTQRTDYLDGHPSLKNRAMFVFSEPGNPETAFLKYEDPRNFEQEIQQYVLEGYMIRTRADADTKEARSGDITRREAAFRSGAQIVSTDYYRPDYRGGGQAGWTTYSVELPGAFAARPNPVNAQVDALTCPVLEK